ncbi:MAG: thioredoxin domain-containing protein [Aliidongia sp.]
MPNICGATDIPVLVDMWAPWCGPCRTMTPLFERAAGIARTEVRLLRLNIDEAQATAARFGVRSIPAPVPVPGWPCRRPDGRGAEHGKHRPLGARTTCRTCRV